MVELCNILTVRAKMKSAKKPAQAPQHTVNGISPGELVGLDGMGLVPATPAG